MRGIIDKTARWEVTISMKRTEGKQVVILENDGKHVSAWDKEFLDSQEGDVLTCMLSKCVEHLRKERLELGIK